MLQFSEGPDNERPRCVRRQRCGKMLLRLPLIDLLRVSPHDWQISQTSNTLGATNSFWLPGPTFCGSHCRHDDSKVLWQSQSSWVHMIHTRMWRHTQHQESIWKGASFTSLWCIRYRDFACSWEIWSGCCSLRINRTMKEEFEDGEVSKGAAKKITEAGSHCTNCGFLNKESVLQRREYCNCKKSHVLLLLSPSIQKTASPVFASASL